VLLYALLLLGLGGLHYVVDHNASIISAFIFANVVAVAVFVMSSPLLAATWFFGVLGRDLMIGIQRMIWGIRIEQVPDMLTAPIEDPDPILSAEEARVRRQVHREARVTAGYGRFKL
jgi:hypothetical protein